MSLLDSPLQIGSAHTLPVTAVEDLSESSEEDSQPLYAGDGTRSAVSPAANNRSQLLLGSDSPPPPPTPSASHLNVEDTLRRIAGIIMRHMALGDEPSSAAGDGISHVACPPSPQAAVHTAHLTSHGQEVEPPPRAGLGGVRTTLSVLAAAPPHPAPPPQQTQTPSACIPSTGEQRGSGAALPITRAPSTRPGGGSPGGIALRPLRSAQRDEPARPSAATACAQSVCGGGGAAVVPKERHAAAVPRVVAPDSAEAAAVSAYLAEVASDNFHEARYLRAQWQVVHTDPGLLGWLVGGPTTAARRVLHSFSPPSPQDVFDFMAALFSRAALTAESSIVALIYVERLLARCPALRLRAHNWRPILLAGLLLASKVWDDLGSWPVEFSAVYPQFSVAAVVAAERAFVGALRFDVFISGELYARYYYALRTLHERRLAQRLRASSPPSPSSKVARGRFLASRKPSVRVMTMLGAGPGTRALESQSQRLVRSLSKQWQTAGAGGTT